MQEEHGFLWRALLDTIDIDLAGRRVLDVGWNRGGFLRLLVDESGIVEGYGYDPASGAIDDARRLAGQRPLTFETAVTVPSGWAEFGVAFSHEVLYLLHDLASHAETTFAALERGAPYFAVMGVHAGSRLMSSIVWMALVAGLIAAEKTVPWRRVAHGTAAVLLALGVLLLVAPSAIPGLTTPRHNQMDQMTLGSS